jgi:hypothetical protein
MGIWMRGDIDTGNAGLVIAKLQIVENGYLQRGDAQRAAYVTAWLS